MIGISLKRLPRPHPATLAFIVPVLAWTLKMTFEPQSPLIDPEHLYRRPLFLALTLALIVAMVVWAVR